MAELTGIAFLLLSFDGVASGGVFGSGSATLRTSKAAVRFGQSAALHGKLSERTPCVTGRTVTLEAMREAEVVWVQVASKQTDADGVYSFSVTPEHTRTYRVSIPEEVRGGRTCSRAISPEARVAVAVRVDVRLPRARVAAGQCAPIDATVAPPKPSTRVQLEERGEQGWRRLDSEVLSDASEARIEWCSGWESIGNTRLRVRWPVQDGFNDAGVSRTVVVNVRKAAWMRQIDRSASGRSVGISVRDAGTFLYRRADERSRTPASNQKLVLSMALLDSLGPAFRLQTLGAASQVESGVVRGTLWILGRGDPRGSSGTMDRLARALAAAGVESIAGDVKGSTGYFGRDWFAPGWKREYPGREVALPTALTFGENRSPNPEREAAAALVRSLRAEGISVGGVPGAGAAPDGLETIASVGSASLEALLRYQNVTSSNFYAEVLGKRLGIEHAGVPGTIAKGAGAAEAWAGQQGVPLAAYDSSGLSARNAVSSSGLVRLLGIAERADWGDEFRETLPHGGQGTLQHRLTGVPIRAKTGTLSGVSALSGYVWLDHRDVWAEFAILSSGMDKDQAADLEDRIVRILARRAG
ncbi:MAG: D-alanyl-D-alanine carboxypeptidase/D-alanyl-D-alanine-endopeptidase [Actinomycetota bacterium]